MWVNAQHDGCPAEYKWRPVLNAAKFGSCPLLECRLPIGECKTWRTQSEFAPGKMPLLGNSRRKCTYSLPAQVTAKHHAKFDWLLLTDVAAVTMPKYESR